MQPVLILQNMSADSPAYLATWLQAQGLAFELRDSGAGQPFPDRITGYGALAILGGDMSANDPLPSLRQAEDLFLQAVQHGVPTLGHCLGGQLMARALGGQVGPSLAPEVGWCPVSVASGPQATAWFGPQAQQTVYQWHYEAFSLPAGAELLASNAACPHQAFAVGPHLAMQFHVELDAAKLQRWTQGADVQYQAALRAHPGTVQGTAAMLSAAPTALKAQQRLADTVYRRWLAAVRGR